MKRETTVLAGAGLCLVAALCQWMVSASGNDRVFDSVENIPANDTGLVLGTSRLLPSRRLNHFFVERIDAAARLYHAGKVKRLILSGRVDPADCYNEPEDMRRALQARDVPDRCLELDPLGFRTIESVRRAREAYGLSKVTVISQEFHNRRALFFCQHYALNAIGFNARSVAWQRSWRTLVREVLARFVAIVEVLRG